MFFFLMAGITFSKDVLTRIVAGGKLLFSGVLSVFANQDFLIFAAIAAMLQDSLKISELRVAAKWQSGSKSQI